MTDDEQPTVRSRAQAAGISEERAAEQIERGVLQLDGERVTDLDQPAPKGSRIVVTGQ